MAARKAPSVMCMQIWIPGTAFSFMPERWKSHLTKAVNSDGEQGRGANGPVNRNLRGSLSVVR